MGRRSGIFVSGLSCDHCGEFQEQHMDDGRCLFDSTKFKAYVGPAITFPDTRGYMLIQDGVAPKEKTTWESFKYFLTKQR